MNQILENSNPHIDILSMMQNLHLTTSVSTIPKIHRICHNYVRAIPGRVIGEHGGMHFI